MDKISRRSVEKPYCGPVGGAYQYTNHQVRKTPTFIAFLQYFLVPIGTVKVLTLFALN